MLALTVGRCGSMFRFECVLCAFLSQVAFHLGSEIAPLVLACSGRVLSCGCACGLGCPLLVCVCVTHLVSHSHTFGDLGRVGLQLP